MIGQTVPELHSSSLDTLESGAGVNIVGVRKYFGSTQALRGVNFHARLGEIHAIVGGNGCGKSTLAKVISGVVPADSGQVAVLGLSPAAPHEARAAGISTVFQEVLVADECTVTENLYVGADNLWSHTLSAKEKDDSASKLMRELTGMYIDPHTQVGSLPLNIKQWITIGRALLCKPKVLILDESSAALDLDSTERLFSKMRSLRDAGGCVIIVTHRIAELIRVCDRATVLRDGVDVGVLEKSEITEKNLLSLMTGKAQSAMEENNHRKSTRLGGVVMQALQMQIWPESASVSCKLRQGEILGIAGLDGQGQSEFVRTLAGVDTPLGGLPTVRSKTGVFVNIEGLQSAVSHGVSYVSGDRKREGIFANLSIYENLLMPLYRRKTHGGFLGLISWAGLQGIFDWEVERLSIRMGERSNKITSLSGGNQQKVLIGRAFALDPDILILNDPARGIDVGAKSELYKHLREFAAQGKSVVYLSSEIEEFVGFCSRVLVFRAGSIFDEFHGNEIHPKPILEAMFGQVRNRKVSDSLIDENEEENTMKIVEFDQSGDSSGRSDRDDWKTRSRPYAGFDKKHAEQVEEGSSFEVFERDTHAAKSVSLLSVSYPEAARPAIKIMEFNKGPNESEPKPDQRVAGYKHRTVPAEVVPAATTPSIKIMQFDENSIETAAASTRSGMKIVEFDKPTAYRK